MRLNEAVRKVMSSSDIAEKLSGRGTEPGARSPEQSQKMMREELVKWGEVARKANLRFA
jgi:tripartite-type tricarboxylate transporter receptor subunit TctC